MKPIVFIVLLVFLTSCDPAKNPTPVASSQSIIVLQNFAKKVTLFGTDANIYTVTTQPSKGVLTGTAPNLTYTPNLDELGDDEFNFSVTDNGGISSSVVTIDITIDVLQSTIQGRSDGLGMDLVITGDAFTASDAEIFRTAVDNYLDYMFNYNSTLGKQRNGWNIHRLDTVSATSDLESTTDTAFEARYNCGNIRRALCVDDTAVFIAVATAFPQFDQILVFVNNEEHGGTGGQISVAPLSPEANFTALHELGHSFAGLADEYTYDDGPLPTSEPSAPNVTINNNAATVKWNHWIGSDHPEIDLFEGGYTIERGVWRPTFTSFMKESGEPFYSVNQEAWSLALYRTNLTSEKSTGTYHSHKPTSNNVTHGVGDEIQFDVELAIGEASQEVDWYVNNVFTQSNSSSFKCCANQTTNYTIAAKIKDTTETIRKDTSNISSATISWSVTVQ